MKSLFVAVFLSSTMAHADVFQCDAREAPTVAKVRFDAKLALLQISRGSGFDWILHRDGVFMYDALAVSFNRREECAESTATLTDGSLSTIVACSTEGLNGGITVVLNANRTAGVFRSLIQIDGHEELARHEFQLTNCEKR